MQSPQTVVIEPTKGSRLNLRKIWEYRELMIFLAWRDLKARYAQTAIGALWVVVQPIIMMAIFTVIFGIFAKIPSDGVPYPLFVYSALIPWMFFSRSIERAGTSVVMESQLVTKVYFPRVIIPFSATLGGVPDLLISLGLVFLLILWYGISIGPGILLVPLFIILAAASSLAVGVWLSALYVRYRDVGALIPLLIQVWMFLSPVAYPLSIVPERWQVLYRLNPMVGVVEGFRWGLLGKAAPDVLAIATSGVLVSILLFSGVVFFNKVERTFADVI
jgi:lipopolysaccharide transport system permease protein